MNWTVYFANGWATMVIADTYSNAINDALENYSVWYSDKPTVTRVKNWWGN